MERLGMTWDLAALVVAGFAITMVLSDILVRSCSRWCRQLPEPEHESAGSSHIASSVVGRCENILTLTFILAGEFTGLALIFAAKAIVKSGDIGLTSRYIQVGTMVNFTISVVCGVMLRVLLLLLFGSDDSASITPP